MPPCKPPAIVVLLLVTAVGRAMPIATAAAASCKHATVTVRVGWSQGRAETVSGIVTRIVYPGSVDVATDPDDGSAKASVERLTPPSEGLFDARRKDTNGDGDGDLLNVGVISTGLRVGEFVRVQFDCRAGEVPRASDFSCVADVADPSGSVASTCTTTLAID